MYHLLYEKEFFNAADLVILKALVWQAVTTYAKRSCNLASSVPHHYARCTKYSVSSMILLLKYQQYKVEKNIEIRIIK